MRQRESGFMLMEVVIALTLLAIGILGFFSSFMSNIRASGEIANQDEMRVAVENITETLRRTDFGTVYARLQGAELEVPSLPGAEGTSATAEIRFHVNEAAIPAEFGPVYDLDGVPAIDNSDCSGTYKMLPTQITLRYMGNSGLVTKDVFVLLGKN